MSCRICALLQTWTAAFEKWKRKQPSVRGRGQCHVVVFHLLDSPTLFLMSNGGI